MSEAAGAGAEAPAAAPPEAEAPPNDLTAAIVFTHSATAFFGAARRVLRAFSIPLWRGAPPSTRRPVRSASSSLVRIREIASRLRRLRAPAKSVSS